MRNAIQRNHLKWDFANLGTSYFFSRNELILILERACIYPGTVFWLLRNYVFFTRERPYSCPSRNKPSPEGKLSLVNLIACTCWPWCTLCCLSKLLLMTTNPAKHYSQLNQTFSKFFLLWFLFCLPYLRCNV